MNPMKSYVKQAIASIKGDDAAALAQKNYRTANAATKGQLAALEAKKVRDEDNVAAAQERLDAVKYPAERITNSEEYILDLVHANRVLVSAKDELDSTEESIKFFNDLLEEFDAEVEG